VRVKMTSDESWAEAMHHLTAALQLLDESDTPADVGAHVAVAIERLSEVVRQPDEVAERSESKMQRASGSASA
jgi:hypothetical protein